MTAADIYNDGMIKISLFYAKEYEIRPKVFISCFFKCKSVRIVCQEIITVYKRLGAFEKKDFNEWVNKQNIDIKSKVILADILQIIYSILK